MNTIAQSTTKAPSARTLKTRENQQKRLDHVRELIAAANNGDIFARHQLILEVSKAIKYHDSGKIEGLFSLDTACSNNRFCTAMQGSCDPTIICRMCYTKSLWNSATAAHFVTGIILSEVLFTPEEAALIAIPAFMIRFNSDGELINTNHAMNLRNIAATHPATTFTIWTKRPEILNPVLMTYGKPANLICGVSSPKINTPAEARWIWTDFVFTVYTPEGIKAAIARGEYPCNGAKCMDCGFHCYKHHNTSEGPVYIAEVLRRTRTTTESTFAAIVAAIDAATLDK